MDYSLAPLQIAPGIVTSLSPYAAKGRYIAGDRVRFWQGEAEKIGGWIRAVPSSLEAPARGVHAWAGLDGKRYVAWGTFDKLWVMVDGVVHDVTPVGMPAGLINGQNSYAWGQSTWGGAGWGGTTYFNSPIQPRVWTLGNWGEDLVACWRGGPLYVWQASLGSGTPAAIVPAAPASILTFFVSEQNRYLVALGADDPMMIRWCSREDLTTWTPATSNTAGDKRLEIGSTIVASADTRLGQLVLTDAAAYTVRYIGPPFIFSVDKVSEGHDPPIGPNAIIAKNGTAFWMGPEHIFTYSGVIESVPCSVENEVYDNLNKDQAYKCVAGLNKKFGEVTFFYPDSRDGIENSRYASFNADGWSIGKVARTSWLDENVSTKYPIATDPTGNIYLHEVGVDADGAALPFELESGEIEIGNGDEFIHVRKLIPDYARIAGSHAITIEARDYPQSDPRVKGPFIVAPGVKRISPRVRGRSMRFKISGDTLGSDFRLGRYRAEIRPDGGRG